MQPTVQPSKAQPALKTLLIMLALLQTATCLSTGVYQHISPQRLELIFPHLLLPPASSHSTRKIGSSRLFSPGVLAFMPCGNVPFLCFFSCCCLCSSPVYLLTLPVFFLLLAGCRVSQNLVLKCEVTSRLCGSGPSLHRQWLQKCTYSLLFDMGQSLFQ